LLGRGASNSKKKDLGKKKNLTTPERGKIKRTCLGGLQWVGQRGKKLRKPGHARTVTVKTFGAMTS